MPIPITGSSCPPWAECDLVLFATPIQLTRILSINKPAIRVRYEYEDHGAPVLRDVLLDELQKRGCI